MRLKGTKQRCLLDRLSFSSLWLQSKLAEYGSKDNLSDQVNAAMATALQQRRTVYVGATLELDAKRAAEQNSPPTRKVSLSIEPLFQATSPQEGSADDALPAASQIRVTLMEQDIISMKEAMLELANGRATVLSSVSKPYRIALVTKIWKVFSPMTICLM